MCAALLSESAVSHSTSFPSVSPPYSSLTHTEPAGPVGSGKTALVLSLCRHFRDVLKRKNICVVTNDIFTKEDGEFLLRNDSIAKERLLAVETGGCVSTAESRVLAAARTWALLQRGKCTRNQGTVLPP